ncbi:RHTO0S03e13212g2_1 [Rhodotorula toruloides]|uniref:RHTO0S03e13212g2_1 n=1 Tax=Rhodotorula toruloides TaxID=5286 RepID=A0A061AMK0_RHOTO|nr:RHTO0S03e13212g2_1 [Rhodotorula toruloides]
MCREYCTDALVRRGSSGYRSATTSSGSQVPFERAQLACHSPGSIFIAWQDLSPKPLRPPFLSLCPRLSFARQLFRLAASVFCYDRR